MVVFVNEDDPQTGNDHADRHRSFCLMSGPDVKRGGTVISRFYNQDSVPHTICRIFGAPPMNQIARCTALELCPKAGCENRSGNPHFAPAPLRLESA